MDSRIVWLIIIIIFVFGCGNKEELEIIYAVDRQNMKMIVLSGERTRLKNFYYADLVIIGGGLSGIAATLAACSSGRITILIEETDSIAACFASQDTSEYFDSKFVEITGSSKRYSVFRSKIKEWYEKRSKKQPETFSLLFSDFEDFGTNNFCFENEAAIDVIYDMIEKHIERERLIILKRHKIVKVVGFNERIASLNLVDLDNKVVNQVTGWMFIDASETGDILPLCDIKYVTGKESKTDTGEPHAPLTADSLSAIEFYYYSDIDKNNDSEYYETDLVKDLPESKDSFKKVALVKESRRIKAFTRIVEQDISAEYQHGPRARFFEDSVGIGYSLITISKKGEGAEVLIIQTKPFQVPYGALISPKFTNLIFAGGTIGTTYITSTAYSAPSVEWVIGESAGEIAAFCAGRTINTHELMTSVADFKYFRNWLVKNQGIPVYWYNDVAVDDPEFTEAQMKPFDVPDYHKFAKTLHFLEMQ